MTEPPPNSPPMHHAVHRPRGWFAPILAGAAALLLFACTEQPQNEPSQSQARPEAVQVGVIKAWTSPVQRSITLVGSTRAIDTVAVTSLITGTVSEIEFDDENMVAQGDLLVRIDDRRAVADHRAAEARVDRAQLRYQRVEDAFDRGAVNQSEIDDVRTTLEEFQAEAERTAAILADHTIAAPFDGRITTRLVSLGALISPGEPVAILNSVDPIEVAFNVPEIYLAELSPGLAVEGVTQAHPDRVFEGRLVNVGAQVDPVTRTAEVAATIDNPDALLRPGLFMQVTLYLATREDAVIIPESALVVEGARIEVFLVENDTVRRTRVSIEQRFPGLVEIADGIQPGDVIVTSGLQAIRQGTTVSTMPDPDLDDLGIIAGAPLAEQPAMNTDHTLDNTIDQPSPPRPEAQGTEG